MGRRSPRIIGAEGFGGGSGIPGLKPGQQILQAAPLQRQPTAGEIEDAKKQHRINTILSIARDLFVNMDDMTIDDSIRMATEFFAAAEAFADHEMGREADQE